MQNDTQMNIQSMSVQEKKDCIAAIFKSDPKLVSDWLKEIVDDPQSRENLIKQMILEDFEEYAELFKALA